MTSVLEKISDDQQLIIAFKKPKQKEKAFKAIMLKYQERVYWLIRRMVIAHSETDDLVQDTFIKVWNNLDQYRGDAALYTWIYRIASNEALGHLRKKKKRFFLPIHDVNEELRQTLISEALYDEDHISFQLQNALLALPEKQRLVFQLKYFEEMKYSEIAKVLETSVGALKASYHHAVKKIQTQLKDYEIE